MHAECFKKAYMEVPCMTIMKPRLEIFSYGFVIYDVMRVKKFWTKWLGRPLAREVRAKARSRQTFWAYTARIL